MRFSFLIILGLVFITSMFSSCGLNSFLGKDIPEVETLSTDDRLSTDEKGLLRFSSELYSGYITTRGSTGQLLRKKPYLKGQLEGVVESFYESGEPQYIRLYNKGKKSGEHIGWFENGVKKFQYVFENGLSTGNHKEWYSDGSLAKDFNYLDGRPFGSQKVWRRDGKIRANYVIRENGKRYGLTGLKRCTKLDGETQEIDPYLARAQ